MPGSQAFKVRLLELVAVSMHQLAVHLFKLEICMHTGGPEEVERVTQYEEPPLAPGLTVCTPEATIFNHHAYLHNDIYPDGAADMAGYWAEDRVLGGVTVFDRPAEERSPDNPPNVWFNSSRRKVTFRYYQLLDYQQDSLIDFFIAEDPARVPCPLPVLGNKTNRVRLDFWDAILHRFVCRDPWGCKPPAEETIYFWMRRPQNPTDYPEQDDLRNAILARFGDGSGMTPDGTKVGSDVEGPGEGASEPPGGE